LKKCEKAFREGLWMIGDGSKIMMCDFFYGRIFTDLIDSPYSFFEKVDKLDILLHFP
tara:strand:- start:167 stop:337 length:171 start_codon:yes stop_codon:yes gene_type:complete